MNLRFKIDDKIEEVKISSELPILDYLKKYDVPWSCLKGHCSACMCKLKSGDVDFEGPYLDVSALRTLLSGKTVKASTLYPEIFAKIKNKKDIDLSILTDKLLVIFFYQFLISH
jgi:hypothetical protein